MNCRLVRKQQAAKGRNAQPKTNADAGLSKTGIRVNKQ